jgi:hypothetical protein
VFQNGKPVKGTFLLQGIFNILGSDFGIPENGNKAVELMEKEYSLNPDLKENHLATILYINALKKTSNRKGEAFALAGKMYNEALQKGANDELMMSYLYVMYPDDDRNAYKRDSLINVAVNLYPKSKMSFLKKSSEFYSMNEPEKVFQLYDSLLKDFPEECKKAQSNIDRTLTIA